MVHVWADQLEIRYLGQKPKVLNIKKEEILDFGEKLRDEIAQEYPEVGNSSFHQIDDKLATMVVRSTEVG